MFEDSKKIIVFWDTLGSLLTVFRKEALMIKEFKEFISQGNVLDMAIGVIIGAAFKAIIDSLVADIITPILNVFLQGVNFSEWVVNAGPIQFALGNFINNIISFLVIAFVLFIIVKSVNKAKAFNKKEDVPAPTTKTCPYCKSEIPLEASRCPHCTSQLN